MTTKTISIMEDAYKILLARKRKNESFSQLIRRELINKGDIMEFAGSLKKLSDKDISEIKNNIENLRKRSTKELLRSN
ncbi:MAG TPA: antitoxin VapB family protein [Candidatus Nanoarchaeia archaeon]|nr:antitoxin VapB family protein [Candidatus Nanoarchaeia archaeon]